MRKGVIALVIVLALLALPNPTFADFSIVSSFTSTAAQPGDANFSVGHMRLTATGKVSSITFLNYGMPFNITFSPQEIESLDNAGGNVSVYASIPSGFLAGTYSAMIDVLSNYTLQEIPISITVGSQSQWGTSTTSFTKEASSGKSYAEEINFTNTGNADVVVNTNVTGNATTLIECPQSFTIYTGLTHRLNVEIYVPKEQPFGYYQADIYFKNAANSSNYVLMKSYVVVSDGIAPTIESFSLLDVEATKTELMWIDAKDNIAIDSVWVDMTRTRIWNSTEVINNTLYITEHKENESAGTHFFAYNENTKHYDYTFAETSTVGPHYATINTNDTSGNTVSNTTYFEVTGLSAIAYAPIINIPSAKNDATAKLLELNHPTTVTVELVEMSYSTNYSLAIQYPNGEREIFDSVGDTAQINAAGEYFLIMNGGSRRAKNSTEGGEYHGKIRLTPIEQHVPLKNISFSGVLVEYPVPTPFTKRVGNSSLVCTVEDTGILDTSFYTCSITYPITLEQSELTFITTVGAMDDLRATHTEQLEFKDGVISGLEARANVMTFGFFFILVGIFYFVFVYPYLYFRVI